jgi:hypothetical protein
VDSLLSVVPTAAAGAPAQSTFRLLLLYASLRGPDGFSLDGYARVTFAYMTGGNGEGLIERGSVHSVNVTAGGTGYATNPPVTFSDPPAGGVWSCSDPCK